MTTNVWVKQEWTDRNLEWNPDDFGGILSLYIPASMLWLPDIVLYNNADGNYKTQIMTKAKVDHNGTVIWEPPAIYKSMCPIYVKWFPFDEQRCDLIFGSWTYDGDEVDLDLEIRDDAESREVPGRKTTYVKRGVQIGQFHPSVEWDLMEVPSERHEVKFSCCSSRYIDITFYVIIRRKTLFYTVNLIIPTIGLSLLTVMAFYLPSESGEKVVLSISVLISLTFFFLLLVEIIPSTSLDVPLIGKYLLFIMVLVICSISVTVVSLNVHNRSPDTHHMPNWIRSFLLGLLPRLLRMRRPKDSEIVRVTKRTKSIVAFPRSKRLTLAYLNSLHDLPRHSDGSFSFPDPPQPPSTLSFRNCGFLGRSRVSFDPPSECSTEKAEEAHVYAVRQAQYVSDHFKQQTLNDDLAQDWRFMAMVLDRMFLIVFSLICALGSITIIMRAPVIYDTRLPLVS